MLAKFLFDIRSDRIGPDCPFTHVLLYFQTSMKKWCKKKFKYFGENASFRPGAYAIACSKISIGDNVVIRPGSMLFADPREPNGNIIIEKNCLIGSSVHIYVANHRYDLEDRDIIYQGHYDPLNVVLKEGCWIGAGAIILPGVTVGRNAVIGAGSVVTKSIPDRVVAVGNPAKVIKHLSKEHTC